MASNLYVAPSQTASRKVLVFSVLGLVFFLAAEALLLRSFIRTDTRPPAWDQSIHMEIALDYREALKEGRLADAWYLAPKPGMPPFPPAYHLLLMRAYDSPDPANAALWVNWFYLALLSVSIFGIAWRFRPDETALAAVILFAASPAIQDLLTTQLVDLPMVALAAAAYWALLASDEFLRWVPALVFGVLHAAGMLHKWSFFSYMLPAYFIALRAFRDRRTALIMLVSAALSAALIVPWYSAHIALLPSRLVQASADFAIPVWTPGAWMVYASQASNMIGPIVWLLGTIGLLAPQYRRSREQGWILLAWFAASYVFWTIVPNRQLRFLMPGLVPIAVAFCSTWPKAVTWGTAALQLFCLLNFYGGWVGPVTLNLPFAAPQFFANRPAAKEDWKTEEILRKIDAERDPSLPISNVTLVANDTHFNAPTFHWMQRRLGLEKVRMRGVNRRLSELSDFVLLKDPKVGPAGVISGLPEASAEIRDPKGWFGRAYEEIARWPLPDSNNAILYRQRRGLKKPYAGKFLVYQHYTSGKVVINDLKANFGPWDGAKSVYATMSLKIGRLDVRGLVLDGTDVELVNVGFIPVVKKEREDDWVDIRLLRLERLRIKSLDVGADELRAFLSQRVKGLVVGELSLDKTVRMSGAYNGKPVSAEAGLQLLDAPRRLKIDIMSVRLAGVSVPLSVFREIKELTIPLYPNPETPFAIELPGLTIANGRLTIP
ncbi:MAG: glycosyltransferase family 39 protein [Elusimicrobia bacterium]|nr:glycosyltransferase family 39 protein [Elusimicrobiota bacterium]